MLSKLGQKMTLLAMTLQALFPEDSSSLTHLPGTAQAALRPPLPSLQPFLGLFLHLSSGRCS